MPAWSMTSALSFVLGHERADRHFFLQVPSAFYGSYSGQSCCMLSMIILFAWRCVRVRYYAIVHRDLDRFCDNFVSVL